MSSFWGRVGKTKTLKITIGGVLVAVGAYLSGEATLVEMLTQLSVLGGILFARDGIAKGSNNA